MKAHNMLVVLVLIFTVGCTQQQAPITKEPVPIVSDTMVSDEAMVDDEAMIEDNVIVEDTGKYNGDVLSKGKSLVLDFNETDYKKALESDKLIVLYFYANWCPTCKAEIPKFYEAFQELESENVIGFRVNFNDDDTDDNEVALAREFGVAYQHTKVFLANGERVLKAPDSWDKDRYITEVNKYLNQ